MIAAGGDSVGPWYRGNTAYGLHSIGGLNKKQTKYLDHVAIYTAVNVMHRNDVRVVTAP